MRSLKPQASNLKSRSAVTILEVMFAILVTAIGLLGAVALLPVASYQARRSRNADVTAAAGRAALSRFDAMGMRQPERWIIYNTDINKLCAPAFTTRTIAFTNPAPSPPKPVPVAVPMPPPTVGVPRLPWYEFLFYQANIQANAPVFTAPVPDPSSTWVDPARNWFGGVDSFCIDPRMIADNLIPPSSATGPYTLPAQACTFPSLTGYTSFVAGGTPPLPMMWRTSLGSGVMPIPGATPGFFPPPMSKVMADAVFTISDDTAFDRDNDRSKPARIGFDKLTGAPLVDGKRRSDGHYSWMATLVPERNSTGTFQPNRDIAAYTGLPMQENHAQTWVNDAYTLSLIVFQDRTADMTLFMPPTLAPNPASFFSERLLEVYSINEQQQLAPTVTAPGGGGGEFLLRAYDINTGVSPVMLTGCPPITGEDQLKIKRNDWICLGGQTLHSAFYKTPPGTGSPTPIFVPIFKWYRVVDLELEPSKVPGTTPQAWERHVSLSGQDWPLPAKDPSSLSTQITWAIVVDGVVSVYEKSIRLEYDSPK